jgi:4-hydroxy-tetrahydrodipicolinate synthase
MLAEKGGKERSFAAMPDKLVHGLYAALLTPRLPDDSVDEPALARLVEFLLTRHVSRFAINGATGEFCLTTPQHLKTIFSVVRKVASQAEILCGIGAAGTAKTLELAAIAACEGARAALLPMPSFFPYQQEDLEAFAHAVALEARLPLLLYNLPEFTSGLDPETSGRILRETPNVIGIKDSGQSLETLRQLTAEKSSACRMVGNDGMLADALREGVCDGVVSGVACVMPELLQAIFEAAGSGDRERLSQLEGQLDFVRGRLSSLPVPWGLKWIAEARGIFTATFSQPVTRARTVQGRELLAWCREWNRDFASSFFARAATSNKLSA